MYQYGLLLEDYSANGEFVNDCIFTLMHHVGGELASLITLFQPKILKTFTSIWKSEFEICDVSIKLARLLRSSREFIGISYIMTRINLINITTRLPTNKYECYVDVLNSKIALAIPLLYPAGLCCFDEIIVEENTRWTSDSCMRP